MALPGATHRIGFSRFAQFLLVIDIAKGTKGSMMGSPLCEVTRDELFLASRKLFIDSLEAIKSFSTELRVASALVRESVISRHRSAL